MINPIITPIDSYGRLNKVLNSYLYGLISLEKVVVPHHLSMAAHGALVDTDVTNGTHQVAEMGSMLYHLATLTTSLHELAACLLFAHDELETFVSEGADLEEFASTKQDEAARLAGRGRKKPSDWPVKPQSLAPFQLNTLLARYFAGAPGGGERIGTSQAVDFRYHSDLLRNGLTFGLRDPGQPAIPTNLTTRRADESIGLPVEQPDERWDGYDVSLPGPEAVAHFEVLLHQCRQADSLYKSLAADDTSGHGRLFELLGKIIDGEQHDAPVSKVA